MEVYTEYIRFVMPALVIIILLGCVMSLFYKRPKPKTVAFLVNEKSGEAVPLHYWETSIGRSTSCDIVLNYATVSRFHAVVSRRKNLWVIFDTDSKTGILINGEPIKKKSSLNDGDVVAFGEASYIFSAPDFGDNAKAVYASALVSGNNGKVFLLDGEIFTVGRSRDCDIYLNLPTVSRKHIELHNIDGKWEIENFSVNGVYINKKLCTKKKFLKDGDLLDIGGAVIKFVESYERIN